MTRRVIALVALALLAAPLSARQPQSSGPAAADGQVRHAEEGRPSFRNYVPREFALNTQNWALVQDRRGVLYVGTNAGVAEYDGVSWRLIEVTNNLAIGRSLAIAADGTIFVGSVGNMGYLAPDATGAMRYVSLLDKVPADARDFADVWRTFATDEGVYFVANRAIFRWVGGRMTVIKAASRFNRATWANGHLYVPIPGSGLNVLDGDTLRPLPGTEALGSELGLVGLPFDAQRLLIVTREAGAYLVGATGGMVPFPTEVDPFLRTASPYRGAVLPDGTFAIATLARGLVVIDRDGRQRLRLDTSRGLASDAVTYILPDHEGGVWAALQGGLARIDYPSQASSFTRADGFEASNYLFRHDGRLYQAHGNGVAFLRPATATEPAGIQRVAGVERQCWWMDEFRGGGAGTPMLMLACSDGLYEVRGSVAVPVRAPRDGTYAASVVRASRVDPARLWVALIDGLASFRHVDGRWIDEGRVAGVSGEIRTLAETPDGDVWAGDRTGGVVRLSFKARPAGGAPRPDATVRVYGPEDGLSPGGGFVTQVGDTFLANSGVKELRVSRYDAGSDAFVTDQTLSSVPYDPFQPGFGLFPRADGSLVMAMGKGVYLARRTGEHDWTLDADTFGRLGPIAPNALWFDESARVAWFDTLDGLKRVDMAGAADRAAQAPFHVLLRRVSAAGDHLLFGGAGPLTAPDLASTTTALRFEFAAPSFVDEKATEYQTRLAPLETEWTDWSPDARRQITRLPPGTYQFLVRARSVTGQIAEADAYGLTILPPWYRTWWAYGVYVLLIGVLLFAASRLLRHRVVVKERERAQFAEARLRAEAAEQLAATEGEGKKQVELLSAIGREITASLDIDTIFGKLYERVNQLADADVFGVGLYHPEQHEIEYRLAIEDGKRYAPYTRDTSDRDQLPVWCIEHKAPIVINDMQAERGKYLSRDDDRRLPLEDGSLSKAPQSVIYVPLLAKSRVLGVITIQSFEKGAYDDHHLNVLQSLASYAGVALDNASAYRQLNEQEHEIRRLFEEAERARTAAEEADAAKSAFLSTVSHELRTPLTSVLGFAKIIKKRLEDRIFPLVPTEDRKVAQTIQQVDDNLKVVVSEGERLTKLIDDVLDLAKIEAGKLEWHMGDVSIGEVIDHATNATSSLFEQKGLRLVKAVDPELPALTGDRDRLVQVVINLISNAVKFTDEGSVTCRAERRGTDLVVSVVDTGVGIAPADQPKVFERFKQVGDTLTDKPKGTGLGLPICKEIIEHHGGHVWVESAVGQGSTFAFSLPLTDAPAVETGGPVQLAALLRQLRDQVAVTTPRTSDRQPRILVVDDEANIRELLTQEFTEAGYAVDTAANGREAVARVRTERPDLVVLDVMMPEMNGFDVAAVLKNDPVTMDIPIVILSIVQDRERGYRVGVDRYLTKPIDTDLLFREVGALIEQRKSHKRVLVVDEDASTVKSLTDVLATRGYSVVEAGLDDVVERAMALQPDIILLNAVASGASAVRMLRFEKGLENVLFLVYQ